MRVLICAGIGRRGRGRGAGRGHGSRVTYRHGDFVELAESVPPAAIVTLDRVISVYPDLDRLAGLSAERARRLYGLVYPRDMRIVRLVFFAMSLILRLLRKPVCGFVHPVDAIEAGCSRERSQPHFSRRVGRVWQVDHREPVRFARPVAVFRVTAATRW
jgi:hypothetical protein